MPVRSLVGLEGKKQHAGRLEAKMLSLIIITDVLLCVYLFWS